jgi:hypothetical protein
MLRPYGSVVRQNRSRASSRSRVLAMQRMKVKRAGEDAGATKTESWLAQFAPATLQRVQHAVPLRSRGTAKQVRGILSRQRLPGTTSEVKRAGEEAGATKVKMPG